MFLAPDTGGGTGTGTVTETLPGTEQLTGGKTVGSADDFNTAGREGLPEVWTADNATGGDEEEEGSTKDTNDTKKAEGSAGAGTPAESATTAEGKPAEGAAVTTTAPERKDWPEAARVFAEKADADLAALKTEVETLRVASAPVVAPTAENPLAGISSEAGLSANEGFAQAVKSWARGHLGAGGELPAAIQARLEGKRPEEITEAKLLGPEETAALLDQAETMLERHVPARREYLRMEKTNADFLQANYPQYLDPKTEEGTRFAAFERQFPQIKQFFPQWRGILAEVVRGSLAFDADAKAKAAAGANGGNLHNKAAGEPIAPVPPGANGRGVTAPKPAGGGAKKAAPKLRPNMDAEELAGTL